jgi:16S rRNA (adenine1518-N6/adenine1519-N6)-dimethyltransferase
VVRTKGIPLKKKFGQHFLRDVNIVASMLDAVELNAETSVFEIGPGDGFLTRAILQTNIARLWLFEIDEDWVTYLKEEIMDDRLTIYHQNFLDVNPNMFEEHTPWTVLSNLPYQVTFPILHYLQRIRHMLKEGVLMMQEEVAQKIIKTSGRGYGFQSLFFQYYFEWKKLNKIPPGAFYPPPKVFSRLLYFKPKTDLVPIPKEQEFWQFIKVCFKQPRRTLKNNLAQAHYDITHFTDEILKLRAQQLSMQDFLNLWQQISI